MQILKNSNLYQRLISSIIGVPIFLGVITFNKWGYFTIFSILNILMLHEFYKIVLKNNTKIFYLTGISFGSITYSLVFLHNINFNYLNAFIVFVPIILLNCFYDVQNDNQFIEIALSILGIAYITLPLCFLHYIAFASSKYKSGAVLYILFLNWANDTGAYFVGSLLGKNKLLKDVSPKKTIEGALGGILICLFAGYIMSKFNYFQFKEWLITGFVVSVTGIYGDLIASKLKRFYKLKDTSRIIPGHGGVLDRFDSLLTSIPLILFIQKLILQLNLY